MTMAQVSMSECLVNMQPRCTVFGHSRWNGLLFCDVSACFQMILQAYSLKDTTTRAANEDSFSRSGGPESNGVAITQALSR